MLRVGWLNEYWNASVPVWFSIPIVAELPCSWALSTLRYCVRIWPFSYRTTSKSTRSPQHGKKLAFRYSITNRLGLESVFVHVEEELSRYMSSQNG